MLKEVMELSKVTAKYQITIPMKVRKELGIVPGTEVDIAREGRKYCLIVDPIKEIRKKWAGRFRDEVTTMDYINEIRGKIE
jgi:AbrB family looped-hinge helix DNA binding protein